MSSTFTRAKRRKDENDYVFNKKLRGLGPRSCSSGEPWGESRAKVHRWGEEGAGEEQAVDNSTMPVNRAGQPMSYVYIQTKAHALTHTKYVEVNCTFDSQRRISGLNTHNTHTHTITQTHTYGQTDTVSGFLDQCYSWKPG